MNGLKPLRRSMMDGGAVGTALCVHRSPRVSEDVLQSAQSVHGDAAALMMEPVFLSSAA